MIVAIIPAKGGSTRLPNKNMALLNGRPMLDYSIDQALACDRLEKVYVTTDSDVIAEHAASRGVNVIRRPETLGGDVPMNDVIRHAFDHMDGVDLSILVCLQPDHPDRNLSIDHVLDTFISEGADRLYCTETDGTKNGAHYITSRHFWDNNEEVRKEVVLIDDCTNIHYQEDLDRAEKILCSREA